MSSQVYPSALIPRSLFPSGFKMLLRELMERTMNGGIEERKQRGEALGRGREREENLLKEGTEERRLLKRLQQKCGEIEEALVKFAN